MNPIALVFSWMFKILLWLVQIILLLVKCGFGWLLLGYFLDYEIFSNPGGMVHLICMLVAWGGTFMHFFGWQLIKSASAKKKKNKNTNEIKDF